MPDVKQQAIADLLNISRTTVSRCFTNHKGINPRTRAAVFSLAAKLGYQYLQPRSGSKRGGELRSVGVLVCSEAEEFAHGEYESPGVELLPGVSEFAQLHHWTPEIHFISPQAKSISDASFTNIHNFKRRLWAGLILIYPFAPDVIGELTARFPCVSLVEQYGSASIDCVDVNHYKGVTALMTRLRRMGHTRFGFLSRRYAVEAAWSYRRFSGFVENLARLGLPYIESDVLHLDISSPEATEAGYSHVVSRIKDGVTAWICGADHQAYDLIIALQSRGFKVPRDVSVTGFDGILRPVSAPLLDTIRIPYYEIGYAACRRLHDKVNKRFDAPQEILLEGRLQEGETVDPPPVFPREVH